MEFNQFNILLSWFILYDVLEFNKDNKYLHENKFHYSNYDSENKKT